MTGSIISLIRPAQAFIKGERARRAGQLLRPLYVPGTPEPRRGGAGTGAMARVGNPVTGALLVISTVIFYGWFLLNMYTMLRSEPDMEYDACRNANNSANSATVTTPERHPRCPVPSAIRQPRSVK